MRSDLPLSEDGGAGARLEALLAQAALPPLPEGLAGRFEAYLALILHWNARVNLTAVRDAEGILARHFVESIACAYAIGPEVRTLLDFGSGAGFPGIPIALCRPEIAVTLAESQGKKAAFLQEAVRTLALSASVYGRRAESLEARFDCVTLRAVDRMERAVAAAARLVNERGWLVAMTTQMELAALEKAVGAEFVWEPAKLLPFGSDRCLAIGRRAE